MYAQMNNSELSFAQATPHYAPLGSPQDHQHVQPVKSNSFQESSYYQGQQAVMANMTFNSTVPPEATEYSLSTMFGNDMNGFQNMQRLGPELNAMAIPQQQQLQPEQQQFQLYSAELLRNLTNQKMQMPVYDHQMGPRLLTPTAQPMLQHQFPRFDDPRYFISQGNGMNMNMNMMQVNHQQAFTLPSPHELTLRDDTRRMRGGVIEPFPEKLHRLLTEVEAAGRSDVISFIAGGKAFAIHKPDKFFDEIVPQYFRQSRLSSFKRQLNLYGFELINNGPTRGAYYHEMFVKDHPELCRRMRRVAVKLQTNKHQECNQKADDCYNLSPLTNISAETGSDVSRHSLDEVILHPR
ncbi:DNA binding protein [Fragilaria crotonensis]|nr:DNA binding protein [Fragilaria crotonensis]